MLTNNLSTSNHCKMANLAVTFTVIFLLFAFSNALTLLDLTEPDVTDLDRAETSPESEPKTAVDSIRLPSEKEIEYVPIEELKPDSEGSVVESLVERQENGGNTESAPFTVVTFHPLNHRFPNRPISFHFRHGRPCRHHQKRPMKPDGTRDDLNDLIKSDLRDHRFKPNAPRDLSNDMILFDPVFHGEVHQIAKRFHHRHDVVVWGEDEMMPHHHHHYHHDHDHDHRHHHEDGEGVEEKEESEEHHHHHHHHHHEDGDEHHGEFMRKIRKFLHF